MIKRGVGYGCIFYGTGYGNGYPDESRAIIELTKEGEFILYVGAAEVGQGAINVMWQIASESLGVPTEKIRVMNSDTGYMEDSGTAAASRQTYNTGNAVVDACEKLKENMDKVIMQNEEELVYLYEEMKKQNISLRGEGYFKACTSTLDLETGQGDAYWPYSFAAQKVVVEVDDETGKVSIVDIVACHDTGKVVNPTLAEGQIEGGCAMGIGYGIMEEVEMKKGEIKNKNFSDYIIPTSMDVPSVKSIFIEEVESTGPFGAKGLGEPVMIPTAPAILNAIYDAVGVRLTTLPATCEKVLKAIKEKEQGQK